jgi:hypothetical protein
MKFINIPAFLVSFLIGILFIYFFETNKRDITIYPTKDNEKKIQFIDEAENCFRLKQNFKNCPLNYTNIPIQI